LKEWILRHDDVDVGGAQKMMCIGQV